MQKVLVIRYQVNHLQALELLSYCENLYLHYCNIGFASYRIIELCCGFGFLQKFQLELLRH